MQSGWQCPVCGAVYAPWVASCQGDHTSLGAWANVTVNHCTCGTSAVCPVHPLVRPSTTISN
jgi:hypothetical protein